MYLTPLVGGILADRVIGQRKSVIVDGVVMAMGEFMLMKESLFFPALLTLIIGNGFFKSNISTQVGGLYRKGDAPATARSTSSTSASTSARGSPRSSAGRSGRAAARATSTGREGSAPARIVSMMMGMWFLSSFFGNYMSGYVATWAERMSGSEFFLLLASISLATGVLMIILYRPLRRAIGDEDEKEADHAPAHTAEAER